MTVLVLVSVIAQIWWRLQHQSDFAWVQEVSQVDSLAQQSKESVLVLVVLVVVFVLVALVVLVLVVVIVLVALVVVIVLVLVRVVVWVLVLVVVVLVVILVVVVEHPRRLLAQHQSCLRWSHKFCHLKRPARQS